MLLKLNKHFITEVISVVSINNRNYSTVKLKENKSTKKIGEPSVSKEEPKEIKTRASTKNINQVIFLLFFSMIIHFVSFDSLKMFKNNKKT